MSAPANNSTKPVAPTSRVGYVFKDKSEKEFADPLKAYEGLALTQCGHYPLGANGSFHGGIHFTAGSKATFSQDKGVRCIADGEVVAYRIDHHYPDATPADSDEPAPKDGQVLRPYSTGFVLVRHRLQPPVPTFPAPPKESAITVFGTDLCNAAGRLLAWLPQGATLRLNGKTNQNGTWAQVDELTTPDQAVWSVAPQPGVWVRVADLMAAGPTRSVLARLLEPSEYRINPAADRPDPRQVKANCDARLQQDEHRKRCAAIANAPTLTWYSLYMQLGDLASYEAQPKRKRPPWWSGEKPETRLPDKLDAVKVLDTPLSIRQGQIVGFLGEDVPSDAWLPASHPVSRELLHLEAFSGDDVPGFIDECRKWAQQLPEDKRTQLGLKSGDELRGKAKSDAPVIATVSNGQTFPLEALKQAKDAEGRIWRQVSVRITGTATATGWIEETGRRVSPWSWRNFQVIEEASNPAGTWWDDVQQFADYLRGSGVRPKETPLFAKIRSWLDSNGDGQLDERELDMVLKDRQLSNLVGGLIVRHRSAWDVPNWKERFGAIDELIDNLGNHEDSLRYRASEMERVRKLDWWSYVAAQLPGFPADSNVYHFHPVALAGALSSTRHPTIEINGEPTELWFLELNSGTGIDDTDYRSAADQLQCETAAIKAVALTETGSSGSYFQFPGWDAVPAILFERHYFHRLTSGRYDASHPQISNRQGGGYGDLRSQYRKLTEAYELDPDAALKSASWGRFQIMGAYHQNAGYSSVSEFVAAHGATEKNHLEAFVNFIKADNRLVRSIRNKDWLAFARAYNGPAQQGYDQRIEQNYERIRTN